jgi:uncharacterized protein YjbI with pentapeptide repeats
MRFLDVRFENSNLRGSSFERTEIIGADFSGASLEGVSFAGANLNNVSFKGANLNGVNFSGAILTNIDFSGANLEAARFGSALAYQMYNLDCQNSTSINLQFSALQNSSLYNCHFESLKLTGYSNTWFYSSDFKDVQFDGTGTNASLYFSGGELSDVYFVHPNGGGLNFSGTKLRNLRFDSASNFYGSIFDSVTLDNVQLAGDFTQSTFSNSDMRAFKFSTKCLSCKFINIDARQSNFSSLQLGNSLYFKSSNLAEANFSNLILLGLTLENVNIEKSDFSGTQLPNLVNKGGVSGTPINLDKRFLIRGGLILGPTVALYELDLTNFDFANVDLRGAYIGFSNISGAKFALAKSVFGLNSRELSGQPANLRSGTALFNGRFVGPGAYLDSGDFHGFDFGQVDLSFSIFTDAKLQGANLYQANVLGASICGAVTDSSTLAPKNTSFMTSFSNNRSYLVGSGLQHCSDKATSFSWAEWYTPGMTFSGRSFEKANFRGINLQFVDFSGSNLRGANLTDARLFGADLSGADLRGATLAGSNLAGATLDGALLTNIQGAPEYLPSGWAFSNGSIVREGSQISGMNITNSRCAAGNESMAIDSQTHLTLVGDASYASTLSMDTTQGFNAKGSCMVWFIDGAVVPSATKLTYVPGKSDIGKKVRIGVVRTDLSGTKTIQLSDELVVGKAKMNSAAPTVTGISKVSGRLTALRTTWAPGASYTYQWFRSGEAISGATKVSYLPSADDHQHGLSVKVCASKAYFETRCETSSASSPIAAGGFPKSPVVQLVVGKLTVGSILTGKPGNWLAGTSLSFQWLRDGVAIKDATLANYTLSSEDRGHVIQFQVTATKLGYVDHVKSSIAKSIP